MSNDPNAMYTAILNDQEETEYHLTQEMIDTADVIRVDDRHLHVLSGHKSFLIEIRSSDFLRREFMLAVNGKELKVHLRDNVESRVHAMGFDVQRNHVQMRQVISPMPGLVLKVLVKEGDSVEAGAPVIVLEAMKMENVLSAPVGGVITKMHVSERQNVDKNQLLAELDDPQ